MKPKPKFNWEQLDKIVADRMRLPETTVPQDAFTAQEFAERYGISERTARDRLRALIRDGVLACGYTRRMDTYGRSRLVRCFWLTRERAK